MKLEDLKSFGPIDSSILKLAAPTGSVVVTEDRALRGELMQREVEVLDCSAILALWQESNT
jgi:rRNA-processing protein FCF1